MFAIKSLYIAFSGFGRISPNVLDPNLFLSSALLLPAPAHVLDIAWSLSFEMLFYSTFLIGILTGERIASRLWWIWLLIVFAARPFGLTDPFLKFIFSPYIAEFLLGCLAARLYPRMRFPAGVVMLALGLSGVSLGVAQYVFIDGLGRGPRCFYWGLSFFLVTLGGLIAARDRPVPLPRMPLYIGDASYSIYLVHNSVQFFIMAVTTKIWGIPAHPKPWIWLIALFSLGVGLVYYRWVELPLLKQTSSWINDRFPRSDAGPRPANA